MTYNVFGGTLNLAQSTFTLSSRSRAPFIASSWLIGPSAVADRVYNDQRLGSLDDTVFLLQNYPA